MMLKVVFVQREVIVRWAHIEQPIVLQVLSILKREAKQDMIAKLVHPVNIAKVQLIQNLMVNVQPDITAQLVPKHQHKMLHSQVTSLPLVVLLLLHVQKVNTIFWQLKQNV